MTLVEGLGMTPGLSFMRPKKSKLLHWESGRVWVINGLPRSGQHQLATRLARSTRILPTEVKLVGRDGRPEWPMDTSGAERAYIGLPTASGTSTAGHSVLYLAAPLLSPGELSETVSCNLIHVVRDPRQLFAAYARRPQIPDLVQLARSVAAGSHLPQLRPLWDCGIPGLDLLNCDDDATLRGRVTSVPPWRLYGIFFYLWMLTLLRNLRNGSLCIELRTLATSAAARSDLIALFSAFGLKVAFGASRIDQYAAHDLTEDLGLPNVPWGSRLARKMRSSEFALSEALVCRQLEKAADQIDLWIAEEDAAALTNFIDPAYSLVLLPFVRPWFAKMRATQKPLLGHMARPGGERNPKAMRRHK